MKDDIQSFRLFIFILFWLFMLTVYVGVQHY